VTSTDELVQPAPSAPARRVPDDRGLAPMVLRSGELTVFLAPVDRKRQVGRRTPVATFVAPALVAAGPAPPGWGWVVGAGLGAVTTELEISGDEDDVRRAASTTIERLGELVRPAAIPPAERVVHLDVEMTPVESGRGAVVDDVSWVRAVDGEIKLAGVTLPGAGAPIGPRLVLFGERDATIAARPMSSVDVLALVAGIEWLFEVAGTFVLTTSIGRQRADADTAATATEQAMAVEARAVRLLAAELRRDQEPVTASATDPLVMSAIRVTTANGLDLRTPRGGLAGREGTDAVRALALASRLYHRRVSLTGRWWRSAHEAVLGFRPDGTPLALLPSGEGMVAVESDGRRQPVNSTTAADILPTGFVFSRPLDDDHVDGRSLLRAATNGRGRLIRSYLGWSVALAAAGLAVPFSSGVVFGDIIPAGDTTRLWHLVVALVLVALATLPLQLALTSARTRAETVAALDVQRGIWGRVLRSPVELVRRIGPGDLAMRLAALEAARDPIDVAVLSALPAVLGGLFAGLVLFRYDILLAVIGIGVALVVMAVAVLLARSTARAQGKLDAATGEINGFMFHVLMAIPKLRVAGAESRAFLAWAERFRHAVGRRLLHAGARQSLLTAMIPTIGSLTLFTGVALIGADSIGIGAFLAFQTTYSLFLGGLATSVIAAATTLQLRPTIERVIEIANAPLETSEARPDQGDLRGGVAFANVTFRYTESGPLVLDGLTFRIEPSQLVAIAGRSGCGKSTIIRLLLGFERPEQGSVLLDEHELHSLDIEAVRRQLGVVMQDGQLIPGTVHENLSGVASLSEREAWELADVVALGDDIRAMPMGMSTVVPMNGGTFSGGQRQRLLIARALAARPRILVLDEATSALDNVTQRVITSNLAELGMTRIIVAHRLSTMIDADRILVVDQGTIAEDGSYDELMAKGGMFHGLASRQVL